MAISDIAIPHFSYPFRFVTRQGVTTAEIVEQDTIEDVTGCVEVALLTDLGSRVTLPDFGISSPTFQVQPIDKQLIVEQVAIHEPRATVLVEDRPDVFDELIDVVTVTVSTREIVNA